MPAAKERKKARRRLKKPKKFHTNQYSFQAHNSKLKPKQYKPPPAPKPPRMKPYNPTKGFYTKNTKIPRVITVQLNTRKSQLNKYGLPQRVTPTRLINKRNQIVNNLINKGVKPSQVKEVRDNWNQLIKAARFYEKSKNKETKQKWLNEINQLSKNPIMFGLTSSKYADGKRVAQMKTVNPNSKTAQKYQELFKKARGDDLFEDEEGNKFIQNGLFYEVDTTDAIINQMGGGSWIIAISNYGNDVARIVNNTGYSMKDYRIHFETGEELGPPDLTLVDLKRR